MTENQFSVDAAQLFAAFANFESAREGGRNDAESVAILYGNADARHISLAVFSSLDDFSTLLVDEIEDCLEPKLQALGLLRVHKGEDDCELDALAPVGTFQIRTTFDVLRKRDISALIASNAALLLSGSPTAAAVAGKSLTVVAPFSVELFLASDGNDARRKVEHYVERELPALVFVDRGGLILDDESPSSGSPFAETLKLSKAGTPPPIHQFTVYVNTQFWPETSEDGRPMVPCVRLNPVTSDTARRVRIRLNPVVSSIDAHDSPLAIRQHLLVAIERQLRAAARALQDGHAGSVDLKSFRPRGWTTTTLNLAYPAGESNDEDEAQKWRKLWHHKLNLAMDRPAIRTCQAVKWTSALDRLAKPHLALKNPRTGTDVALVEGDYLYYHYMQDGMNDSGWGCAYRSLQTIMSWLQQNGHTAKSVPSHVEIQKKLVEIGDRPEKFVGSRQWIGSIELGLLVDAWTDIPHQLLTTNSGADVVEHARQLARHFRAGGAPVMIGGGELAHTILGVDFDENSGTANWLVLDPHYTGADELPTVTGKGWCGWKPDSFWKAGCFYNLLLVRPKTGI